MMPASTCSARPAKARNHGPAPGSSNPYDKSTSPSNDTFKSQLDLEQHAGRTIGRVRARVAQRVLALTAAIWHNDNLGLSIRRSLTAYHH